MSEKDLLKKEFAELWLRWEKYVARINELEESSGIARFREKKALVYARCCEIQKTLGLTQGALRALLRADGLLPGKPNAPAEKAEKPAKSKPVKPKVEPEPEPAKAEKPKKSKTDAPVFGWEPGSAAAKAADASAARKPKKRPTQSAPS